MRLRVAGFCNYVAAIDQERVLSPVLFLDMKFVGHLAQGGHLS